ncbi:MAG: hypothetical protein V3V04_03475 [Rhizobiaceae bacterium]
MVKRFTAKYLFTLVGALSLGVLGGCSSGTTYGTGVSQEAQLASDIGGLMLLTSKKKHRIDYSSRPKLVNAPKGSGLPAPAEKVESDSAYFPTNPEEKRKQRYADAAPVHERSGQLPDGELTRVRDSGIGPKIERDIDYRASIQADSDRGLPPDELRALLVEGKKKRLQRIKELRQLGAGVGPRKYLTQPPVEYRTPVDSAPIGEIGEKVYLPSDKRQKGIFDS